MRVLIFILAGVMAIQALKASERNTPGQSDSPVSRIRVFLDCDDCNESYMHRKIEYVDFVRDPGLADVHIFVTEQKTASHGLEYGINFLRQGERNTITYKLVARALQDDSDLQRWEKLVKTLHIGLLPYLSGTPELERVNIHVKEENVPVTPAADPWNFWVVRLKLASEFETEEKQREFSLDNSLEIERITEERKFRSELYYETDRETFRDDELIVSTKKEAGMEFSLVQSMGPRWSLGVFAEAGTSTFLNTSFSTQFGPALEYNIFPWDRSDRKVLTFAYHIRSNHYRYLERSIFDQTEEWRASEALRLTLILRQPWGEIESKLEGSHYFHDFSKNRLSLDSEIAVRVARGLSLFMELEADLIHDQLYLSGEGASREEILLNQKKLQTSYELEMELGLRFAFGSIYNNIVNERFQN